MYIAIKKMDKDELKFCEIRDKALTDWTSGVNNARREGIKEGVTEATREIARNFKAMGLSTEQIAQGTGLTEQQIKEL